MSHCNSQSFTSTPTARLLWRNSAPMFGAILALFAYDLLESSLLALQSEAILTAFGFTLPITAAMTALAIGLSIHANNKTVHCNCVDQRMLSQVVSNTLFSNTVVVLVFSILFFLFNDQLLFTTGNMQWLQGLSADNYANSQNSYMSMRYLGWVFMALFWQANAILRALGWMKYASTLMFSWALMKAFLAVLVLTPQSPMFSSDLAALGIVHLCTDMFFAFISLWVIRAKVPLKRPRQLHNSANRKFLKTDSLLVIFQQFITPISMAALTAIAASVDTNYVAALALLFRLEALFLLIPMVLTTSMPALVGANFWLGKHDRVASLYLVSFGIIIAAQLILAILLATQYEVLTNFVCPHDAIATHLDVYLTWVPWSYATAGIAIVFQSCLNAKKHTLQATLVALCHRIILLIPLASLGILTLGDFGFYHGLMLGHIGAALPVIYLFKRFGYLNKLGVQSNYNPTIEGIPHETDYSR